MRVHLACRPIAVPFLLLSHRQLSLGIILDPPDTGEWSYAMSETTGKISDATGSRPSQGDASDREKELMYKLGDRSMVLFFVAFIAFLELLVIFQLSHPGGHFG